MKRFIFSLVFFAIASVSFGQNIKLSLNLFPGAKIDSVNRVELTGYEILLNQTRDSAGVGNLVRKAEFKSLGIEPTAAQVTRNPSDFSQERNFTLPNLKKHNWFTKIS